MQENPWLVGIIQSFLFLNCPECDFKTRKKNFFQNHAHHKHPLSKVLFEQSMKKNLLDFKDLGLIEQASFPIKLTDFRPNENSFHWESNNEKTLEELMFSEVNFDKETSDNAEQMKIKSLNEGKVKNNISNETQTNRHKELTYNCSYCDVKLKSVSDIRQHNKVHENVLPIALLVLRLKFGAKSTRNFPKDYMHSKEYNGMLKCHIGDCKFETNQQSCIESHIKRKIIIQQLCYTYIFTKIKIKCNDN
jgi:hypothetical protein